MALALLETLWTHPDELLPMVRVQRASKLATKLPSDPDYAFCYDMLNRVSRSFAVVIQQLGPSLRDPVCIFYLVLRALDTVEDDMAIPADVKLPILNNFHDRFRDPDFRYVCGTKDYRRLMDKLDHVRKAFFKLDNKYQGVIMDITKRMGQGMAKFITSEVETVAQYDEYCHYVAGLVGIGLSDLFATSKLEVPVAESLSNSMGLFLQKTNIIRDYLEDILEEPAPRMFWPKEIWGKYAQKLEDFKDMAKEGEAPKAVDCLNELVTDALRHALDCLEYMERLKDKQVFRFCAIPQVMAIGTLAKCYGNVEVFRGAVKLRRGLTAKIMDGTKTMADVYGAFYFFSVEMADKISTNPADPNAKLARQRVGQIVSRCMNKIGFDRSQLTLRLEPDPSFFIVFSLLALFLLLGLVLYKLEPHLPKRNW